MQRNSSPMWSGGKLSAPGAKPTLVVEGGDCRGVIVHDEAVLGEVRGLVRLGQWGAYADEEVEVVALEGLGGVPLSLEQGCDGLLRGVILERP